MEKKYIYYIVGGILLIIILYFIFKPSNKVDTFDQDVEGIKYQLSEWSDKDKQDFLLSFYNYFNLQNISSEIVFIADKLSKKYRYNDIKDLIFSPNMVEQINKDNLEIIIYFTEIVNDTLFTYKWNNITDEQLKNNFPGCDIHLFKKLAIEHNYNYLLCIVLFTLLKYIKDTRKNINDYDDILKSFISDMKPCYSK